MNVLNVRITRIAATAAILAGLGALVSCQQFFTTSLAPFLARDSASYAIPADLPVADAVVLLDEALASGDTEMAAALVTPLYTAALAAVTEPAGAAYQEAAGALLDAVVLSSGVGPAVTSLAKTFASVDMANPPDDLMTTVLESLATVALDPGAETALQMLAVEPPASMSADDAYTSAIALVTDAYADVGSSLGATLTADQSTAFAADPSVAAAALLIQHAAVLKEAGGESTIGAILPPDLLSLFLL